MTAISAFLEWGGPIRPARSRTALVVGASEDVRTGWARYFEALRFRTLRCAGPQVMCSLLAGDASCPLHRQADVAVYEETAVTPELMLMLLRSSRSLPIAFGTDRINDRGQHEPQITAVRSGALAPGCVGPDPLVR